MYIPRYLASYVVYGVSACRVSSERVIHSAAVLQSCSAVMAHRPDNVEMELPDCIYNTYIHTKVVRSISM